jgi:hypothetical protein
MVALMNLHGRARRAAVESPKIQRLAGVDFLPHHFRDQAENFG